MNEITRPASGFPTRRDWLAGAGASALACLGMPARAQGAARPFTVSYPARGGVTWPLWLAKDGGYFDKHGLNANLLFGVHPAGMATLISGEAQMTNYGMEQVLTAVVRDPTLVVMGSSLNRAPFLLVTRQDIGTLADLKGKRIGVARLGDPTYIYSLEMLRRVGLSATDVQWVPSGTDGSVRANMIRGKQIDASLLTATLAFRMQGEGMKILANLADFGDIYVSTANVFKKSYVAANPDVPARMIMAQAEAIKRFYDDREFAIATYRSYDPQPVADVAKVYDLYQSKNLLERVPMVLRPGMDAALARLSGEIPALKSFDTRAVVDNSATLRLIREGWFEKLFGAAIRPEQDLKLKNAA